MYVIGQDQNKVSQYPLVTGFDVSTTQAVTHSTAVRTNNIQPKGMSFNNDGTKLFIVGVGGSLVIDNGDDEQVSHTKLEVEIQWKCMKDLHMFLMYLTLT